MDKPNTADNTYANNVTLIAACTDPFFVCFQVRKGNVNCACLPIMKVVCNEWTFS